jgi:prephenate dehydrogenase
MGGSVAWRAAQAGVGRIVGYSPVPAEGVAALKAGAITEIADRPEAAVSGVDFVVLATPPAATLQLLQDLRGVLLSGPRWFTDVASVKGPILARAHALGLSHRFAGSHPLAGTHESGFAAAKPSLLEGAVVYVTPAAGGERASEEVADFWSAVCQAAPVVLDAAAHDRLVAWTSHLPQATASALAAALEASGPRAVRYGSGARDTTRLAGSHSGLWHEILLLNRIPVLEALDALEAQLGELRRALATGNAADLLAWLERGRAFRRRLDV